MQDGEHTKIEDGGLRIAGKLMRDAGCGMGGYGSEKALRGCFGNRRAKVCLEWGEQLTYSARSRRNFLQLVGNITPAPHGFQCFDGEISSDRAKLAG